MRITLDGSSLTPEQVVAAVFGDPVRVDPVARARARMSHLTALRVAQRRPVYGRTTGVGANLGVAIDERTDFGLRLLRSHASGAGRVVPAREARAMLVVRANQLLVGAAGVDPAVVDSLVAAITVGAYPVLHELGAVGTGDLTAMAELALTLIGERAWADTPAPPVVIAAADALALLSSSALTIAQAALAFTELDRLARVASVVAALSFLALRGSSEAYSPRVHAQRPHPGSVATAARMLELIEPSAPAARLQDPYCLRSFPTVHGALLDALSRLRETVTIELNAGAENPLVCNEADDVFHHGNFHQAPLALALDLSRLALLSTAQLGSARIAALLEPRLTGLAPFLADGPAGSSGVMAIEYTAACAVTAIRAAAMPCGFGSVVLSRGAEEHASFAPQSVRQTLDGVAAYRIVLAAELVCAVRALRMSGLVPGSRELRAAFDRAGAVLPADTLDRPLDGDLALAAELLEELLEDLA